MTNTPSNDDDDRGNPSKSTGASGGGSFGNQRGAPATGGSPDNGERGDGDVHPSRNDVGPDGRKSESRSQRDTGDDTERR
jgi:hypothetical protein